MSRDLVTFNRNERDARNKETVERLCTDMGCSEPVARNFLKYKKFGIGPLADWETERMRLSQRSQRDRLLRDERAQRDNGEVEDPLEKMRRVKDFEKRLKEQKEKEEQEEQEMLEEAKRKQKKKRAGLAPLGPVMAREEAVDPLQKVATGSLPEPEPEGAEAEVQAAAPEREAPESPSRSQSGQWQSIPRQSAADWRKEEEERKKKAQEQQTQQKHHKKKKKRRRGDEEEEKSEESEKHVRKRPRSRSRSAPADEEVKKASSSAGLMTEKEVLAMMGKEKAKEKPQRGSVQARMRIQREMQEWNSTKAENEEFWKAPRFALCYSAETSRTLRGNTGPNMAESSRKTTAGETRETHHR